MTTAEKILVPAAEAAALLSMGKSTFWREVAKGNVPAPIKLGNLTRWRVSDIILAQQAINEYQPVAEVDEIIDSPVEMSEFSLYRHFDKTGTLLYVGVSLNALGRLAEHNRSAWAQEIVRVEITKWASREASMRAERRALRTVA
jgi:predicted DNA-binding transcriptional regulator AlpA